MTLAFGIVQIVAAELAQLLAAVKYRHDASRNVRRGDRASRCQRSNVTQ